MIKSISNFTGRKEDIEILNDNLKRPLCLTVVSGMGGVGKTCLVRHFVNQKKLDDWNILWLASKTEEDLKNSITQAATALSHQTCTELHIDWNKVFDEQLENFYNILDSISNKTLLIFDNAHDKYGEFRHTELTKYFSISMRHQTMKTGYQHHIIVTTRRDCFLKLLKPIQIIVRPLPQKEAVELCKISIQRFGNSIFEEQEKLLKDIERLCSCLGNYPLAIQQAIAYLNEKKEVVSIDDFIGKYQQNVKIFQEKEAQLGDQYSYTVGTVFDLSLNVIGKTEKALEMINILSFCVAEKTRMWLFEVLYGETVAKDALAALVKFNLVSFDKWIFVHPVVQKVIRDRVLENSNLIPDVFQAAFVNLKIYETLKESNHGLHNSEGKLNDLFLHHWNLVHTNKLAAAAIRLTVFCKLDNIFPWGKVFGSKCWAEARSVLEQTCFRWNVQLGSNSMPTEVTHTIQKLILRDEKAENFEFSSNISIALNALENEENWTEVELPIVSRTKYIRELKAVQQQLKVPLHIL